MVISQSVLGGISLHLVAVYGNSYCHKAAYSKLTMAMSRVYRNEWRWIQQRM